MTQLKTTRFGALALGLLLAMSTLTTTAFAATAQKVTATLEPSAKILLDGTAQTFYNAAGTEVQPITYNKTIYLPARSVSELRGQKMSWDEATLTMTISGERTTAKVTGKPDTTATKKEITVQVRPDFNIVVDGKTRSFTDTNGTVLAPMLYGGTIYLPLKAAGDLLGKTVAWDAATSTATLTTPAVSSGQSSLVTDADSFGRPTQPATQPNTTQPAANGSYIGEAKAKSIALNHAGLSASDVTFARATLDRDDGRWEYEVEFYTNDYQEYDYEIDAVTGAVRSFDYDAEYYKRPSTSLGGSSSGSTSFIGQDRAKEIALTRAGVSASAIYAYKCELDRDDGVAQYEIDFKLDGYEYEVDINAITGNVTKYNKEWDD